MSLEYDERADFDRAAGVAVPLIEQILKRQDLGSHLLYNINIPTVALERPTEVRVVPMAKAPWAAEFDRRIDPKGRHYYWATGTPPLQSGGELTDMQAWQQGFITITPLRIDRTDRSALERMRDWQLSGARPLPG